MQEITTTLKVVNVDAESVALNDLVVLAGRLRRVMMVSETTIAMQDEDGTQDWFPIRFFGPTWKVALL